MIDLKQARIISEIITKEYPSNRDRCRDLHKIMVAKSDAVRMFPELVKELAEWRYKND